MFSCQTKNNHSTRRAMTNIVEKFTKNKSLIAGIIAMAKMFAKELSLNLNASLSSIAEQLDVNRNYVYEVQDRITAHLMVLLETGPGRPANSTPLCGAPTETGR